MRKRDQVWGLFYPIAVYFVMANFMMLALEQFLGTKRENYMIMQTLSTLGTFPLIFRMYRADGGVYHEKKKLEIRDRTGLTLMLLVAVFASMGLNNLIYLTGLTRSGAYQQVTEAFFGGRLFWEVAGTCVMAPVLEEFLYRGILYRRAGYWYGRQWGMLLSAGLFALMHMNLVQGIYAFGMGLVFVWIYEETDTILGNILAHALANLIAVIRTETQILHVIEQSRIGLFVETSVFVTLTLCSFTLYKRKKDTKK